METVMGEDRKVKKVGMKDMQRDGWEYELTVSLSIDRDTHMAIASKDRTELFEGKEPFIITEATGTMIRKWCETGEAPEKPLSVMEYIANINAVDDIEVLKALYKALPSNTQKDPAIILAVNTKKAELSETAK
jgi:hypothetical protein